MLLNNTQTDLLKLLHYKIGDMFVDVDNNSYTILKVGEETILEKVTSDGKYKEQLTLEWLFKKKLTKVRTKKRKGDLLLCEWKPKGVAEEMIENQIYDNADYDVDDNKTLYEACKEVDFGKFQEVVMEILDELLPENEIEEEEE